MSKKLKILVVGPFASEQRDAAIYRGFQECGSEVYSCGYGDLLYSRSILTRVQFKLAVGPVFIKIQNRISEFASLVKPDVIFFRRPLEFSSEMIMEIKKSTQALFVSFNNDDPFSSTYVGNSWKNLRDAIPCFDLHFAFRTANLVQYKNYGAKNVALWEPFYSPWIHRPIEPSPEVDNSFSKILFAMHAEKDERREMLAALVNGGLEVNAHSWNWAEVFGKDDAQKFDIHKPLWGDEYVSAITSSMATLCFFSKQNNDELTSRVFEIPACLGLLLSWRTERLADIFKDWEEAVYFSSAEELVDAAKFLKKNPSTVTKIKKMGHDRLLNSRCSVVDRCSDAITLFNELL